MVNDAPVVFDAPGLEDTWRPENYSGKFYGPTRLRKALINSRNLVSIRLLRSIGIGYAIKYARRFGFKRPALPRDLSLSLGSGTLTPIELATGYSVFANGGFKVEPYLIDHIVGPDDKILELTNPVQVCVKCVEEEERKQAELEAALAADKEAEEKAAIESARQEREAIRMAKDNLPVEGGETVEQSDQEQQELVTVQPEEEIQHPAEQVAVTPPKNIVLETAQVDALPLWLSQDGEVIPFQVQYRLRPRPGFSHHKLRS